MDAMAELQHCIVAGRRDVAVGPAVPGSDRCCNDRLRNHGCCAGIPVPRQVVGSHRPGDSTVADIVMTALAISNVVLWIVVVALLVVVLALTRQVGVLHERVAPAGALMINRGLAVGEQAPAIDVLDLHGQRLRVGAERADGLSPLILFLSPTCPVCESLLPVIKSSRKDERHWLQIVLA